MKRPMFLVIFTLLITPALILTFTLAVQALSVPVEPIKLSFNIDLSINTEEDVPTKSKVFMELTGEKMTTKINVTQVGNKAAYVKFYKDEPNKVKIVNAYIQLMHLKGNVQVVLENCVVGTMYREVPGKEFPHLKGIIKDQTQEVEYEGVNIIHKHKKVK